MSRFIVRDDTVAAAFEYMRTSAKEAARAKADRQRREDLVKAAKADGYLSATGTVAEREAAAILNDGYVAALEGWYQAIERDEEHRNLRTNAELVIEAWRSTNANRRVQERLAPNWEPVE